MKKVMLLLAALTAAAVMMTACGRNRNDADTNSTTQTEAIRTQENETAVPEESGIMDDAEDLVSDVVDDGREVVSDVVDEGRDIVTDLTGTDETRHTTETSSR